MINISLTEFLDFVMSSGPSKLTKVRRLKAREKYSPAIDFWRPARKRILEYHQSGENDKSYLDGLLKLLTDKKKQTVYPEVIAGYKKFLGKKQISCVQGPKVDWKYKELVVRVNPELLLTIEQRRIFVKLYFKRDAITQQKIAVVLLLIALALGQDRYPGYEYGVVDLRRAKLVSTAAPNFSLTPMLLAEAEYLITVWDNLPD